MIRLRAGHDVNRFLRLLNRYDLDRLINLFGYR